MYPNTFYSKQKAQLKYLAFLDKYNFDHSNLNQFLTKNKNQIKTHSTPLPKSHHTIKKSSKSMPTSSTTQTKMK